MNTKKKSNTIISTFLVSFAVGFVAISLALAATAVVLAILLSHWYAFIAIGALAALSAAFVCIITPIIILSVQKMSVTKRQGKETLDPNFAQNNPGEDEADKTIKEFMAISIYDEKEDERNAEPWIDNTGISDKSPLLCPLYSRLNTDPYCSANAMIAEYQEKISLVSGELNKMQENNKPDGKELSLKIKQTQTLLSELNTFKKEQLHDETIVTEEKDKQHLRDKWASWEIEYKKEISVNNSDKWDDLKSKKSEFDTQYHTLEEFKKGCEEKLYKWATNVKIKDEEELVKIEDAPTLKREIEAYKNRLSEVKTILETTRDLPENIETLLSQKEDNLSKAITTLTHKLDFVQNPITEEEEEILREYDDAEESPRL